MYNIIRKQVSKIELLLFFVCLLFIFKEYLEYLQLFD